MLKLGVRRSAFAVAACLLGFAAWPSSSGATLVELQEARLAIVDSDGIPNVLDVRQLSIVEFEVYDEAGGLTSGVGCGSLSDTLARCTGHVLNIRVDAGAGDDLVGLWDIPVPTELLGGDGNDALAGGAGPDHLRGGDGEDSLSGTDGEDRIETDDGDDFADGDAGSDTILGGAGDDILDGRAGDGDVVAGGDGRDLVAGGRGDDQLEGGADDDALLGGAGRDSIGTGLGEDDVFGGGGSRNEIDCRAGDRARGQAGALPTGCAPLPASAEVPDEWPPEERISAIRSQTVFDVFGKPVRPAKARKYWVWVGAPEDVDRRVRVRVKLRRGNEVLARRCVNRVWTHEQVWRRIPRRARSADRVTGRVRFGRRCP